MDTDTLMAQVRRDQKAFLKAVKLMDGGKLKGGGTR